MISDTWDWLTDGSNWSGPDGIGHRIFEHLWYSGLTLLIAALIAIPLGSWIAHTGKGKWLVSLANSLRAVPSLGLLFAASMWLTPKFKGDSDTGYLVPAIAVLVILAIPALLAGAYSGVSEVDPAARDAAKGMGMSGTEVFTKVELPCALPLMFSGLRSATLQVIATATIAAFVGLDALGAFLRDGLASSVYPEMIGGSILVAGLALVADLILALIQRSVVSPGLTGKAARARRRARSAGTEHAAELAIRGAVPGGGGGG
ncbi:ABC transporter permease [Luteipulveratus mongoliensis]|uniref:ABC transporter permease n=1 Tax=Luteipulveratus mongoliensis TaxID=571913 RepID=A0A0K1JRE0_9MICO|nr:ABC transporter permease [Luteipulveratus mongoliensis]